MVGLIMSYINLSAPVSWSTSLITEHMTCFSTFFGTEKRYHYDLWNKEFKGQGTLNGCVGQFRGMVRTWENIGYEIIRVNW